MTGFHLPIVIFAITIQEVLETSLMCIRRHMKELLNLTNMKIPITTHIEVAAEFIPT